MKKRIRQNSEALHFKNKLPVGILGATGMVGQRFITLLDNHPWFEVVAVAASPRSAGKPYREAVGQRWVMNKKIPEKIAKLVVLDATKDKKKIADKVSLIFSALNMDKAVIRRLEEDYAALNIAVVSNNSAHRWTEDVPMVMPEINPQHLELIHIQRKNRGWGKGLIVVKPNCSIQSYVPVLDVLREFGIEKVSVTTLQAISGAGKTFTSWPQMQDNVIPYISGEEEKSEKEPLRVWGKLADGKIKLADKPIISATCIRVPVTDGHMAAVGVSFTRLPTRDQILKRWKSAKNPLRKLHLPSAPAKYITYFEEDDRPQTAIDKDREKGMGISVGRLRKDELLDWKFISLSHNTIRGAAGGAILTAELLIKKRYIG